MTEPVFHDRLLDDPRLPRVGQVIAGRYRISKVLGEGGFGAVYLAQDEKLEGEVAIKVLDPEKSTKRTFVERFEQEIRLTRKLRHHNSIKIWDAGTTETGCLYMAMEHVVGETLEDILKREGGMEPARMLHIAIQVLKSLAEAHEVGILHRDLKPANIMLCQFQEEKDYVKVLDFGIAKALSDELGGLKTATGTLLCTPNYASPELLRNRALSPASDLYSLGLIMIEMLTGQMAVKGDSLGDIIAFHIDPRPLPLPPGVERTPIGRVLDRATAKALEDRYQSASEMLCDIRSIGPDARARLVVGTETRTPVLTFADRDTQDRDAVTPTRMLGGREPQGGGRGLIGMIAVTVVVAGAAVALALGVFSGASGAGVDARPSVAGEELRQPTDTASGADGEPVARVPGTGRGDGVRDVAIGGDGVTTGPGVGENAPGQTTGDRSGVGEATGQGSPASPIAQVAAGGSGADEQTDQADQVDPGAGTDPVIASGVVEPIGPEATGSEPSPMPSPDSAAADPSPDQATDADGQQAARTYRLQITSRVEGAEVYLDGERIGVTPFDGQVPLRPDAVRLEVRADGYRTWRETIDPDHGDLEREARLRRRRADPDEIPTDDQGGEQPFNPFGHGQEYD